MDEGMQIVGAVSGLSTPFNQNVSLECYNGILSMLLNGAQLADILHALVLKIERSTPWHPCFCLAAQ